MSTIVTRAGKGSALTHNEVDANFTNLNTDKIQSGNTAAALTITSATINGGAINSTTVGATTPASGSFSSLTDSGNLTFTGTGNRITGDFSNATVANRVAFQTSTVDGATQLNFVPNGTATTAGIFFRNSSSTVDGGQFLVRILSTEAQLSSTNYGAGTTLPMTFYIGGSERMRIDTSGNVGIGTSSPSGRLHVESSSGGLPLYVNSTASAQNARIRLNSTDNASSVSYVMSYSHASLNKQAAMLLGGTGSVGFYVGQTAGAEPTTGTLAQTIDSSGNVGIGTSSPGNSLQVSRAGADVARFTNTQSNGGDWQFKIGGGGFEDRRLMITDRFSGADNVRVGIDSNGNFQFNSGYGSAAVAYGCRAWVNFNGTGTVAIRESGNVSSITDNGTGNYTVNFATAMPDINYAAHFGADGTNPVATANESDATTRTVSAIRMVTGTSTTGALADRLRVSVSIFR